MMPDSNPFDDNDEDLNPFASKPNSRSNSLSSGSKNDAKKEGSLDSAEDVAKRAKELAAWEEKLKKREMEITRKEEVLAKAGITFAEKNWPPFYPIIHHDVAKDIPIQVQKLQYLAFASWLGIIFLLCFNVIAVLCCAIGGGGAWIFFLALVYALFGCPLSYFLWYQPLYEAMGSNNALKFGSFFLFYSIHIIFCFLAVIAPPFAVEANSLTGLVALFGTLPHSFFLGFIYFLGCLCFSLEMCLSIYVLQRVFMYFRGPK